MGKALAQIVARLDGSMGLSFDLYGDRPDLPFHSVPGLRSTPRLLPARGYRLHAWEQFALPRAAWSTRADVLHCFGTRAPWWQPVPTVVTIHDDLPWQGDEPGWPRGWYLDRWLPAAFRKSAAVVTDSESSCRDLVRRWPELETKLHVIRLGIGDEYFQVQPGPISRGLQALGVREPYVLYVGGAITRKRPGWALRVFDDLDDPTTMLVLAGVNREDHGELATLVRPDTRRRLCFLPFVDERDMPRLYQSAVAVLYPTTYEGFGFPVVEAQAAGTPVLFSPVGSLAELQGPGAVVLPPDDLSTWVRTVRGLLASRGQVSRPDREAQQWSRGFSWDVCASQYALIYERALNRAPCTTVPAHPDKYSVERSQS